MSTTSLLNWAQRRSPRELINFARAGAVDKMNTAECYAVILALASKLEQMIDDQAASIRFDFRRVADHLEDAELAQPMDGLAPENAYPAAEFIQPSDAIEQATNLADIYHAVKSAQRAIDDAELAANAAEFEVP